MCARKLCMSGAAVIGQLSFKTAMKHKAVVVAVACSKTPLLGVFFDAACRCAWCDANPSRLRVS